MQIGMIAYSGRLLFAVIGGRIHIGVLGIAIHIIHGAALLGCCSVGGGGMLLLLLIELLIAVEVGGITGMLSGSLGLRLWLLL